MVKPEKFDHFHLVYHLTVSLTGEPRHIEKLKKNESLNVILNIKSHQLLLLLKSKKT